MNVFTFLFIISAICSLDAFKTAVVPNEFIVHFHSKYLAPVRESYIAAKLLGSNVTNWEIVPRLNVAWQYPSDFDVLRVFDDNESSSAFIIERLQTHPSVKAVVPQLSVRRILNYDPYSNLTYFHRHPQGVLRNRNPNNDRHRQVCSVLHANILWKLGITGKGVKVAIFDTGLTKNHPHFRNVKERTNWTNEKSLDDRVSHGTFVAGVIASSRECLGFAPDADLYIFKVFTNSQVSYTSWFLDAFNYAIYRKINILNLSIGGPDFMDSPFVEKVLELSANNVIMISAAGNDGPLYGTLNNPGDQSDVVGVGGIQFDDKIAKFSSRGMTTWELPFGYGRMGLDIVTYGSQVEGSDVRKGCRRLSGTSVSSPVVAGAAALLISGAFQKIDFINPASLKQVLIEGAEKLPHYNMFEQGAGKLNLLKSMQLLLSYKPKITLIPAYLDFTQNYMWPYSSQPLYYGSSVAIANVTILNGISVTSQIVGIPKWIPDIENQGQFLQVSTQVSPIVWPWTGWMSIYIAVKKEGDNFEGICKGSITLVVESFKQSTNETYVTEVDFPLTIKVTPKPPRNKRILWDQYHSLRYPPRYIPRDDLKVKLDPLDWRADHIHTNFKDMYTHLRNVGYYIDVLREPFTCFNASDYGALLIVDPERGFADEEINALQENVYKRGLNVVVFGDWYNTTVMKKIKFFDENTRQWWTPDTGGANIPALNDLLKPFGIAFGDFVGEGHFKLGDHSMYYASGATIIKFPMNPGDILVGTKLNDQGLSIINPKTPSKAAKVDVPIFGMFQTKANSIQSNEEIIGNAESNLAEAIPTDYSTFKNRVLLLRKKERSISFAKSSNHETKNEGRIAVYGDSNCLDSTHLEKACYWLLITFLDFAINSHKSSLLQNLNRISEFHKLERAPLPLRISRSILKSQDNNCEQFEWLAPTKRNNVEQRKSILDVATLENEENEINLIKFLLDEEIAKLLQNNDYLTGMQSADSLMSPIIFLIILSLIVIILFVLFLKRRFIL
ncbi:membrane-bound transcription factor site-1 protease [Drosophila sechellia]|uniref:Membrane-bound transcription factor site-1 protease n=1 Tax=Drosophila sechellia TaxID=7238 RepID=B4IAS9_DROSE|nr:membrane-bound transcription factor site-1 protease [Drosophila sechellia]EDW44392.1 GM22124 [Drosophila sechellia]